MPNLAWYWWALIGVVVVAGGYVKLQLLKKMMSKKDVDMDE
ncbi:hypothetical protein [Alkaliphilus hydrothermalis]|uniref:Uncharacterized protein n=1 Tax=Alkaliphilus hydrothermalis TaxID=1482730 RepID=A0ABS2NNR1_9FIRM|nr:hypothetical protein [Alkaliphilus hydrothermalis]MBM7614462.1 hypothetical protein [Alkaliphilus hydrothermalis]